MRTIDVGENMPVIPVQMRDTCQMQQLRGFMFVLFDGSASMQFGHGSGMSKHVLTRRRSLGEDETALTGQLLYYNVTPETIPHY